MVVSPEPGDGFIAVDWGTTNRRAYLIEGGEVTRTGRDARGVTAVPPGGFPAELAAMRAAFGALPVLLAGMVGSTIGWAVAPYVPAPAGLSELAAGLLRIDERTAIVPGLSLVAETPDEGHRADVMRGEEVQLLGALVAGLAPADALLCQPGTHCKWVDARGGRIERFTTAMTGELFALLRGHSLLASQLAAPVTPGSAFRDGVAEGARRDLAAALFGIRAAGLQGIRDDADATSYVSGLLIRADVAARLADTPRRIVHLLADPSLGALYAAAVETLGHESRLIDSQAAFVAGAIQIRNFSR